MPQGVGRDSQALPFGDLQIQTHPFAINQHETLIDQLLTVHSYRS